MAKSGITWASKSKFQRRCWISAFDEGLWWLWILKIYSFDSPSVAEEFLEEGWNFEQHQVRSETRYHWFPGMWFTRTSRKSNAPSSGFQVWRCSRKLEMSLVFLLQNFSKPFKINRFEGNGSNFMISPGRWKKIRLQSFWRVTSFLESFFSAVFEPSLLPCFFGYKDEYPIDPIFEESW